MNMQDKDMDQLFRSKLDNYEVEPSPIVWANISDELGGAPQRKSMIPMLRIAASVAVVITAGAYFWPKHQDIATGDKPNKQMAGIVKPVVSSKADNVQQTTNPAHPVNTTPVVQGKALVNTQPTPSYAALQHHKAVNKNPINTPAQVAVTPSQVVNTPAVTDPVVVNTPPQQIIAATAQAPTVSTIAAVTNTNAVVPDIKLNTAPVTVVKEADAIAAVPVKKHKIRGLGGLINAAVGLVDKREDKIIEFTNNEDGDTITGINLGIVSIKKNNK